MEIILQFPQTALVDYSELDELWIREKALEISFSQNLPLRIARRKAITRFEALRSRPKAHIINLWESVDNEDVVIEVETSTDST